MRKKPLHLVGGYGTLLYTGSLNRSLRREPAGDSRELVTYRPYTASGYQRLFNLRAAHYQPSHRISEGGIEMGAANIRKQPDHAFNGLCFYVNDEELRALDERERYYRRIKAPFLDFESGSLIDHGYLYVLTDAHRDLLHTSPLTLLPQYSDIAMARTGCYAISDAFGLAYDNNTYLADGTSRAMAYYARQHVAVEKNYREDAGK